MPVTMEMLSVVTLSAPKGPVPAGLKVVALGSADSGPTKTIPVLAIGSFTFWPMSYDDNRLSFGMVMYGADWNVVTTQEMKGARYIYKITLDGSGSNGTVTFWGQSDQKVQIPVSAFDNLMLEQSA